MKLNNLKLTPTSVFRDPDRIEALDTSVERERNEDGTLGKAIKNYAIICAAHRGDTIKIKLPPTEATKVTKLTDLLRGNDTSVIVGFENLTLRPYAMQGTDGKMYSGVSGRADSFAILPDADDLGDFDVAP